MVLSVSTSVLEEDSLMGQWALQPPTLGRVGSPQESSRRLQPEFWPWLLGDRQPGLEMLPYSGFPWSSS